MMLFVFDLQSWDVSIVHVLLHCMSGLHWLFQDVCMFACTLLLALDCLVYACFMYWFLGFYSCFELWSALSQSSWIRCYISVTYYDYYNRKNWWRCCPFQSRTVLVAFCTPKFWHRLLFFPFSWDFRPCQYLIRDNLLLNKSNERTGNTVLTVFQNHRTIQHYNQSGQILFSFF